MKSKAALSVAMVLLICGVSNAGTVELSRIRQTHSEQQICEGQMYSHRVQAFGAYVGCANPANWYAPVPIEIITDYYATKRKIHDEMWLLQGRVQRPGRGKFFTVRGPCGSVCYMHEARPNGSYTLVNLRRSNDHITLGEGSGWKPSKPEVIQAKVHYPDEIRIENGQIIGGPKITTEGCVNITVVENTVGLRIKSGQMCDMSSPVEYNATEKKWGRIDGKVVINAEII